MPQSSGCFLFFIIIITLQSCWWRPEALILTRPISKNSLSHTLHRLRYQWYYMYTPTLCMCVFVYGKSFGNWALLSASVGGENRKSCWALTLNYDDIIHEKVSLSQHETWTKHKQSWWQPNPSYSTVRSCSKIEREKKKAVCWSKLQIGGLRIYIFLHKDSCIFLKGSGTWVFAIFQTVNRTRSKKRAARWY